MKARGLIGFLVLAGAELASAKSAAHPIKYDKLSVQAPNIGVVDAAGNKKRMRDLFAGQPTVLHIWATWCTACRHELPALEKKALAWKKLGINFVAVSIDEPAKKEAAMKFIASIAPDLPVWLATSLDEAKPYYAWGLPMTYFIDRDGKILGRTMGEQTWESTDDADVGAILSVKK